jgi:DNA-binding LacI/PurR family transcriptional regulator
MLERKVDGVAVMTFGVEEFVLDRFVADEVPIVLIDVDSNQPRSGVLAVDYRAGINEAVQHLAVLGHRNIAFISGPLRLRSAETRRSAFLHCMRLAGLNVDPTFDGGLEAMKKILALPKWPTAIMCSNDMTAIGVQHALFEAKLKVPEDFSLVGFDDIHLAEYTIPPLTTVRMSCKDLALAAVNSLLTSMAAGDDSTTPPAAVKTSITTRLIVRQTTGLPKGALSDLARSVR